MAKLQWLDMGAASLGYIAELGNLLEQKGIISSAERKQAAHTAADTLQKVENGEEAAQWLRDTFG